MQLIPRKAPGRRACLAACRGSADVRNGRHDHGIDSGRAPERFVDWWLIFDLPGHPPAQRSKRLGGRLPASLINLPQQITGDVDEEAYHSLAARDLQRGQAIGLPSGEAVAREIGAPLLDPADIGLSRDGWRDETPLWLYILREADVLGGGDRLGPVGGRIVGEVLVGILDADPESFRVVDARWTPTLPAAEPGRYGLLPVRRRQDRRGLGGGEHVRRPDAARRRSAARVRESTRGGFG